MVAKGAVDGLDTWAGSARSDVAGWLPTAAREEDSDSLLAALHGEVGDAIQFLIAARNANSRLAAFGRALGGLEPHDRFRRTPP